MAEKQFSIVGKDYVSYYSGYAQIVSNGTFTFAVWESEEDAQKVCDLLNEQGRKINVLRNSCEIMNQRLSEKSKCDYKKAIIEFCKFMNINTPLLDVMVDEFLQEMF